MDERGAEISAFANASDAPSWAKLSLGGYSMLGGSLFVGSTFNDSMTIGESSRMFMKTGGSILIEAYEGDDYVSIDPMSNDLKAVFGGGRHTYYARLGPGNDIITGSSSPNAPLDVFVMGNDGFDYILEDLSTPGWSLTRPYSDASVVTNTREGTEWRIFDSVEAIGSGDLWYLTKDMARNKFIPLTWSEVLEGGKREVVASNKRNRKKGKKGSNKRFR